MTPSMRKYLKNVEIVRDIVDLRMDNTIKHTKPAVCWHHPDQAREDARKGHRARKAGN